MSRRITLKTIGLLLVVIVALSAFWFSSKPSDASFRQSDLVLLKMNLVDQYDIDAQTTKYIRRRKIVRKGAHLIIYMMIGIGATLAITDNPKKIVILIFLLASLDEGLQIFTGRGARLSDIFIDLIGGIIGYSFVKSIKFCYLKK